MPCAGKQSRPTVLSGHCKEQRQCCKVRWNQQLFRHARSDMRTTSMARPVYRVESFPVSWTTTHTGLQTRCRRAALLRESHYGLKVIQGCALYLKDLIIPTSDSHRRAWPPAKSNSTVFQRKISRKVGRATRVADGTDFALAPRSFGTQ